MTGVDFQQRATREGRVAQHFAEQLLAGVGFRIVGRNRRDPHVGITINYICRDVQDHEWYFDVSGAATSERAGLRRTDTLYKALGRALVLGTVSDCPVVLLTTNVPEVGSVGDRALRAVRSSIFDVATMTDVGSKARLRAYATNGARTPLPGYWSADELFGPYIHAGGASGARKRISTERFGDRFDGLTVTGLPHRVKFMIPSTTQAGVAISSGVRRTAIDAMKIHLNTIAGGSTTHEARGSWVDPFDGLVCEDVQVVESYSPRQLTDTELLVLVDTLLKDLDQHTAAIVIDGEMLLFSR